MCLLFDVAAGERSSSACQDSSRHPAHVRLLSTPTLHIAHCAPIVVADDQLSVCGSGLTAVTIQTLYYLNHLRRLGSASCPNLPSAESHSLLLCLTEQTHAHLLVLAHLGDALLKVSLLAALHPQHLHTCALMNWINPALFELRR